MPKKTKLTIPITGAKHIGEQFVTTQRSHKVVIPFDPNEYKNQNFDWCINTKFLKYHKTDNPHFHIYKETVNDMKMIFNKLDSYSSWNWRDIERSYNKTSCGYMPVDKLDVKDMVERHLQACSLDDDCLYKIEINNHHRVWGIREGTIFYLIWDDDGHYFYKHKEDTYSIQHAG